jgi:hypothetical protein
MSVLDRNDRVVAVDTQHGTVYGCIEKRCLKKSRTQKREVAEKYVRDCLSVSDGTADAGILRIGTTRFKETVQKVMDGLSPWDRPKIKRKS